jgi:hypothetical protein
VHGRKDSPHVSANGIAHHNPAERIAADARKTGAARCAAWHESGKEDGCASCLYDGKRDREYRLEHVKHSHSSLSPWLTLYCLSPATGPVYPYSQAFDNYLGELVIMGAARRPLARDGIRRSAIWHQWSMYERTQSTRQVSLEANSPRNQRHSRSGHLGVIWGYHGKPDGGPNGRTSGRTVGVGATRSVAAPDPNRPSPTRVTSGGRGRAGRGRKEGRKEGRAELGQRGAAVAHGGAAHARLADALHERGTRYGLGESVIGRWERPLKVAASDLAFLTAAPEQGPTPIACLPPSGASTPCKHCWLASGASR